ncbi:MAG: flagellar protein [Calditrichaeota bacterium]|nr:flagellar protein [Calditrichota bacterium]
MAQTIDRLRADRIGPPVFPAQLTKTNGNDEKQITFAEYLRKECDEIGCRTGFSGHAQARVDSRGISLQADQLVRLDKAIDSADDKSAEKALVMIDDMALIVGVKKRMVITVVDAQDLKENVFTKIDAAVIA